MSGHRFRCFFDIEVENVPLGRVIFELFNDVCPKTSENFRNLCTGEAGEGSTTKKPLHYKGVKFHRVIKDFMVQAGDFSAGNGTGGESIYGGHFEDENFDLNHDCPFLLSMANRGKDTNGSQFFITTQPASHLDGKHVVFGRVLSGEEVVVAVENLPVDNRSRPLQPVIISCCGELVLQRAGKTKTKEKKKKKKTEIEELEDEKRKKKKKKDKKQKHKKDNLSEDEAEEGEVQDEGPPNGTVEVESKIFKAHPLVSTSCINPDEIPEVPKNRFLDRGFQNRNNTEKFNFENESGRMKSQANVRFFTRSGRKVKGRGSLRYRTPSRSRSRSRSATPPHWRQAQRRTVTLEKFEKVSEEMREREDEMEDRRKRREERHRMQDEGMRGWQVLESEDKNWGRNPPKVAVKYKSQRGDKTDGDWRVARQETSIEVPEGVQRRGQITKLLPDLREKLDRHGSNKENIERKRDKFKADVEDIELDDNALDYEAPSDNEEELDEQMTIPEEQRDVATARHHEGSKYRDVKADRKLRQRSRSKERHSRSGRNRDNKDRTEGNKRHGGSPPPRRKIRSRDRRDSKSRRERKDRSREKRRRRSASREKDSRRRRSRSQDPARKKGRSRSGSRKRGGRSS